MRAFVPPLVGILGSLALIGVGAWMERDARFEEARTQLRGYDVPTPLLDSGTLGAALKRGGLVEAVPNDGARFPKAGYLDPDDLLVFRRKGRGGDDVYRANPSRAVGGPDSALPEELRQSGDWTIVSVAVSPEDLTGEERGLLTHLQSRTERRASVSIYRRGKLVFESRAGFKMHGGTSRKPGRAQSFRLHFRRRYGTWALPAGLLFDGELDPVRTVVIRRPENYETCLSYDIARRLGSPTPETSHVLYYINGQTQGPYVLTQHLSRRQYRAWLGHEDFYLFRRRGIADRESTRANLQLRFWAMDLAGHATAEEVERYVDLDGLTAFLLAVAFCGTNDWEQGASVLDLNDPDARWSWLPWDMDRSFRQAMVRSGGLEPWEKPAFGLILDDPGEARTSVPAILFRTLIVDDPGFRESFARYVTDSLNHLLTPAFLMRSNARYAALDAAVGIERLVTERRVEFLERRSEFVREDLRAHLRLPESVSCRVTTDEDPFILEVDGFRRPIPYAGEYYAGQTITLRSPDSSRYRWSVDGEARPEGPLEVVLERDTVIRPLRAD